MAKAARKRAAPKKKKVAKRKVAKKRIAKKKAVKKAAPKRKPARRPAPAAPPVRERMTPLEKTGIDLPFPVPTEEPIRPEELRPSPAPDRPFPKTSEEF